MNKETLLLEADYLFNTGRGNRLTNQWNYLTMLERDFKPFEPVKIIYKRKRPVLKGTIDPDTGKLITVNDLKKRGLLNPKRKNQSTFEANRLLLKKLGYTTKKSKAKIRRVRRQEERAWIKARRGSTNEFTCKERRIMKNKKWRNETNNQI